MSRIRLRSPMQWARRASQAICLVAFVGIVLATRLTGDAPSRLLRLFFDLDPLVALATWISSYTLTSGALLSLLTVASAFLLGRVFCGWICPFGAAHAVMTWVGKKKKGAPEKRSPWQRGKYVLLIVLLVMAFWGVHWIGVFDPFSLFYRSMTVFGLPAAQYAVDDSSTYIFRNDSHVFGFPLTQLSEPVYEFFRDRVFRATRQSFLGGNLIAFFFLLVLALNLVRPRFWCRYVCPLGGLLGVFSRWPALRLKQDEHACVHCGLCARNCPAAAQPDQAGQWLPSECFGCWNCVASCNKNALSFVLESPLTPPHAGKIDLSRRMTLGAMAGGAVALTGFRQLPTSSGERFSPGLIRPPGSLSEREFLQRCIQCGLCMRACPTNALHPCGLEEGGLEALWTPKLVPKIGYCNHTCVLCSQVCPTGAIRPITLEEKPSIKIGLAAFDKNRCLPYTYGVECIICEEHCPESPKAIYFVEREVTLSTGEKKMIKQPEVDASRCTGCGICEWSCVYKTQGAIRVSSVNESRHPKNIAVMEQSPY